MNKGNHSSEGNRHKPRLERLGRQRPFSGTPDAERRLYPDRVDEPQVGDARAEAAVRAVAGIRQDHAGGDTLVLRSRDLVRCDLRLGPCRSMIGST